MFNKLSDAVGFESFLDKKFVGQKRFSLEGCEALIPAMDIMMGHGNSIGIEEYVVGMAHRGRLNVLSNIFKKDPTRIFTEFEGKEYDDDGEFSGDVKYHKGYSWQLRYEIFLGTASRSSSSQKRKMWDTSFIGITHIIGMLSTF